MINAIGFLFILLGWPPVWYMMFPANTNTFSTGLAISSGLLAAVWFPVANALAKSRRNPPVRNDDSMAYGWDWLVRPIQTEQRAAALLSELAKGWYALALLQAFGMIGRAFVAKPVFVVSDLVLQSIAGYLLPRSRSRLLAVILFLYAFASGLLGSAAKAQLGLGATNFSRSVFEMLVGFRGVQATIVYHKRSGSVPVWKNVAAVAGMLFGATVVVFLAFGFMRGLGEGLFGRKIPGDILGAMHYIALLAVHLKTRQRIPSVIRLPSTKEHGANF